MVDIARLLVRQRLPVDNEKKLDRWQKFDLYRDGANNAPKKQGVYVLFAEGVLVYIGEAHGINSNVHARLKTGKHLPDWARDRAHKHFQICLIIRVLRR